MNHISQFISVVFHPVFSLLFAFLLYLQINHFAVATLHSLTDAGFWMIIALIGIFSCIMPISGINAMRSSGIVSDWELSNHKERVPVLIASTVFLCFLYVMLSYVESKNGQIFYNFYSVIVSAIVLGVISTVISYFWKISLHAIGISGLAGAMIAMTATLSPVLNSAEIVFYNSLLLLVVGIVAVARLQLKAHSLPQVLAGMFLGFTVSFVVVNQQWYF